MIINETILKQKTSNSVERFYFISFCEALSKKVVQLVSDDSDES